MSSTAYTTKICTIVGLVFEGITVVGMFFLALFFRHPPQFVLDLIEAEDLSQTEQQLVDFVFDFFAYFGLIVGILVAIVFVVNLVLFTKVIKGQLDREKTRKVLIYQAVWGGISLLFNQIGGVLYLVSGIAGLNQIDAEKDKPREGL